MCIRDSAYPGTCRNLPPERRAELEASGRRPCIRLRCPSQIYAFEDAVFGPFRMTLEACGGDFALRRSDGVIAYQLAVVVDDGLMGITQVVRGEDLLVSTPRQLALFDLLGYPRPAYMHLPLLCDPEGERLAKRHASLTLASLRDAGVSPAAVAGYLGWKAVSYTHLKPRKTAKTTTGCLCSRKEKSRNDIDMKNESGHHTTHEHSIRQPSFRSLVVALLLKSAGLSSLLHRA